MVIRKSLRTAATSALVSGAFLRRSVVSAVPVRRTVGLRVLLVDEVFLFLAAINQRPLIGRFVGRLLPRGIAFSIINWAICSDLLTGTPASIMAASRLS
jgi:hypothetical protein